MMLRRQDVGEEILLVLRKIGRALDLHSKVLMQSCGLTVPQLVVLRHLSRWGPIPVGQLAQNVSLSHATVTGILDRLERRELVRKRPDLADRRRVFAEVTAEGRLVLDGAPSMVQQGFAAKLKDLEDWEQSLMLSSLQRLGSMLATGDVLESEPLEFLEEVEMLAE